jgi:hypothetical protein
MMAALVTACEEPAPATLAVNAATAASASAAHAHGQNRLTFTEILPFFEVSTTREIKR